jgi:sugar fermentation stimulation protein A
MSAPGAVSFPRLLPAVFAARPNRFLVHAHVDGVRVEAACGDPGRLIELLRPGVPLLLAPCASDAVRRTRYTVVLARQGRTWVSVQPVLANRVFAAALESGGAAGLHGWRVAAREVRHGASRFDFLLRRRGRQVLTEVKSVSLVEKGRALFPDAPTARGARHVRELIAHRAGGGLSMLVFVVQRPDARDVSPYAAIDPELADAVAEARRAGVQLAAYTCRIGPSGCRLDKPIPVVLP